MFEFNRKYGFHDTEITDISLIDNELKIFFSNGIYVLDNTGREDFLTESCCMNFLFDKETCCLPEESVTIYLCRKNKRKSVSIEEFKKILSKTKFGILFDYYSRFARSVMFKGYILKYEVEFIVEEIAEVIFSFGE